MASSPAGAPAIIEVRSVGREFPGPPPVHALRHVDLTVSSGDFVAVVGRSGSGKSTLLNVLGLMDTPTTGVYRFEGDDVGALSKAARAGMRGRRIGFVFQSFHLMSTRSVLENVALAGLYAGTPRPDRLARARTALERMGLPHRIDASTTSLSGGERQRVAIARALAAAPSVVLADEPTGNLDSTTSGEILDLFEELNRAGTTIVMITHDRSVAERARRTVTMADGVLDGS